MNKDLSTKEKDLIKKFEQKIKNKTSIKEDYLKQTDRSYKDGDRN